MKILYSILQPTIGLDIGKMEICSNFIANFWELQILELQDSICENVAIVKWLNFMNDSKWELFILPSIKGIVSRD